MITDRWDDEEAARAPARWGRPGERAGRVGEDLALRTYASRLLGAEPDLVLHGGGNTSVKGVARDLLGDERPVLFVKASGRDLAAVGPADHPAVDLERLRRLARAPEILDDGAMARVLRSALIDPEAPTPSIEAPVHAVLPGRFVDHTHADAILALTNRPDGERAVREALLGDRGGREGGDGARDEAGGGPGEVVILPYTTPGHELARAVAAAVDGFTEDQRRAGAMVWMRHGLVTWGETAEASYRRTIELVRRAERFLEAERTGRGRAPARAASSGETAESGEPGEAGERGETREAGEARRRLAAVAPVLRGLLARSSGDADRPWRRVVLRSDTGDEALALLARPDVATLAAGGPLTADHLIRTKAHPLLIPGSSDQRSPDEALPWDAPEALARRLEQAVRGYEADYEAYVARHRGRLPADGDAAAEPFDPAPRVVLLPGCGVVAAGADARQARVALDIALHTLRVKAAVADAGAEYEGLDEAHLFDMELRPLQLAKLRSAGPSTSPRPSPSSQEERVPPPARCCSDILARTVAIVTGAAGAIGVGICRELLAAGAHVAATDLAGPALDSLVDELAAEHPGRVLAVPLDVTDPAPAAESSTGVAAGFDRVVRAWGGVDLVVANAGAAHVATIETMELADFERLERINVHGTLLVLREAARRFRVQGTGGDVVVISTKNVFAPGASFSAYSATKAASHQVARIASQEMAGLDVRVNMVAPDAVFGGGARKSGLWQEVGPDRMKARGLTEEGLEEYYRGRNLLKARITAAHVGRAVVFFASRQTPTTGATLPVDGGLPDATPR